MKILNRRSLVFGFPLTLAPLFSRPSIALAQEEYPHFEGRKKQWDFIIGVASSGFLLRRQETALSGKSKLRMFRERTTVFFRASQHVRKFISRFFDSEEDRRSSGHVYARFSGALFFEYSGDYWTARTWYGIAARYLEILRDSGGSEPSYNGVPVGRLIPKKIARMDQVVKLADKGKRPSPGKQGFRVEFYGTKGVWRLARDFVESQANDIPYLFGHSENEPELNESASVNPF